MNAVNEYLAALAGFWHRHQDSVVMATAAVILVLVGLTAWRFYKTKDRAKVLGTVATVATMIWESEGVLTTAVNVQHIPLQFVGFVFFVFELLLGSTMFRAEQDRRTKGHPGWAGRYTFVVAMTAGGYAALGEHNLAGVFLRIGLPLVTIGYYWFQLISDWADDTAEVIALRKEMKTKRNENKDDDSVWVNPLTRIFIKLGLKKPRGKKITDAERQYRIDLMVTYGYRVYAGTFPRPFHRWRLGAVAGTSAEDDVQEARLRLDRKIRITNILLPEGTRKDRRKQSGGQSGGGQSTERLDSQAAVTGAVTGAVSQVSRLASQAAVTRLTDRLPTAGDRLGGLTGVTGRADGAVTDQSTDYGQSTATDDFPTDDDGLVTRLRNLIESGAIKADPHDGTIAVADAVRAFSPPGGPQCGRDKARRLLLLAGLYREPRRGVVFKLPPDEVDDAPQKVNGHAIDLAG